MAGAALLAAGACCEIEDGTTDIDSWPMPKKTYDPQVYTIKHPAMLHSADDIAYTKAHLGQAPWSDAYQKLLTSGFCDVTYKAAAAGTTQASATSTTPAYTTTTPISSATVPPPTN